MSGAGQDERDAGTVSNINLDRECVGGLKEVSSASDQVLNGIGALTSQRISPKLRQELAGVMDELMLGKSDNKVERG